MDELRWGTAEQIAAFQTVFDVRGGRTAMALSTMVDDAKALTAELEKSVGFAGDVATMMDAGIGGSWRKMTSAISDLATRLGRAASGPVMQFFAGITAVANRLSDLVDKYPEIASIMMAISSGATIAGIALFAFGSALAVVGTIASVAITAGSALATAIAAVGIPVVAVVAGVGVLLGLAIALGTAFAALVAWNTNWSTVLGGLGRVLDTTVANFRAWSDDIFALLEDGQWQLAGEMAALALASGLIQGMRVLLVEIKPIINELLRAFAESVNQIAFMYSQLPKMIAQAVALGRFDPIESFFPIQALDRRLVQAQEMVTARLVELQKEADKIEERRAQKANEVGKGRRDEPDSSDAGKAMGRNAATGLADELQAELAKKSAAVAKSVGKAVEAARATAERYATETAGTFSGRSMLAPMRIEERQVELLTSIDEHLDRIESRPPVDPFTYDE
ncbi:MAG TPA: phage tail tape measure protein [Pirellulaceae bacterium]|nr:phage tail tape measure protein [Pirellulaceae bacterium]